MTTIPSQQPSGMPFHRYTAFQPVTVPDRTWPDRKITRAPRWLSTDLRDGNQALIDPMSPSRKMKMFELLVRMGYKEIEVGFPAASQFDFDFVRQLVEGDKIPDDVRVSVLTQAREDLIARTVESLVGADKATVHLYNATAPLFQRVVFNVTEAECIAIATRGTECVMKYAESLLAGTDFGYQYSPEIFTQTPTDFALGGVRACLRRVAAGARPRDHPQPAGDRRDVDAQHLRRPDRVLRARPDPPRRHRDQPAPPQRPRYGGRRDRAGADGRCRPGRGVPVRARRAHRQRRPGDAGDEPVQLWARPAGRTSRDIDEIRRTVEYCTQLPVHPRHPYAGDLVYTAFSGSHQDAIKKGLEDLDRIAAEAGTPVTEIPWEAPYLPIDPKDVGRTYEAVIRVNSQSGKGGVAYVLKAEHSLDLPRRAQIEFSRVIQQRTDAQGGEVTPEEIWSIFRAEYLDRDQPYSLERWTSVTDAEGDDQQQVHLVVRGEEQTFSGMGNGPVAAFVDGMRQAGADIRVLDYAEHALSSGGDAVAAAYVECEIAGEIVWGIGIHHNIVTASLRAVVCAANRAQAETIPQHAAG